MKLQKFENVDVIASLEAIMKQNTAFYQSDFDIDKQILQKAAVSPVPEDKRLLWFSRPSGTCCFRERDVFLKDTRQHNTWRFYGEQTRDTILANRRRGIEKGSFHVLLDVADFGGVFLHTVQYKADMFAVQFHKFCFYKLCRVVVPGDTDCSSFGADSFKNKGKDFLYPVPVKVSILYQIVVLDIVLDDFLIHAICVCRFLSLPFRRLCRVL